MTGRAGDVRVGLTFSEYQDVRTTLAESSGALRVAAKHAGDKINQPLVTGLLSKIEDALELLRDRAFADERATADDA